jgi:hypothetical protein
MSKQTAVEWLIEEINQQQERAINAAKKDKSLRKGVDAILTATTVLKMKCEQAKEMEKEQHRVTAQDFYYGSHSFKNFEQYYNETYGNT